VCGGNEGDQENTILINALLKNRLAFLGNYFLGLSGVRRRMFWMARDTQLSRPSARLPCVVGRRTTRCALYVAAGKTELTKRLTEFMFNTDAALIRVDMSEYDWLSVAFGAFVIG
jgi:hypothetical protein